MNTLNKQIKTKAEQKRYPHTKIQISKCHQKRHEKKKLNKKTYSTLLYYTILKDMGR